MGLQSPEMASIGLGHALRAASHGAAGDCMLLRRQKRKLPPPATSRLAACLDRSALAARRRAISSLNAALMTETAGRVSARQRCV